MLNPINAKIASITPGSIADQHGIESGDCLLNIDKTVPKDLIDYQFLIYASEKISLTIQKADLSEITVSITKRSHEDIGIIFESAVFDKIKHCNNKCVFCFVDQQPKGLRDSLYIKDDDYRLSFLQGTYITLTNLTKQDKDRIEKLGLGPFYVSVHTTNPELRVKMLGNPNASKILDELRWLESLMIPVHCQIVLCPGLNDSYELINTLVDLLHLENIESIAVVPVGITIYRQGDLLQAVTKEIAEETLSIAAKYNKLMGKKIIFPADEFFFLADIPLPETAFYDGFPQLDDGVGSARLVLDNFCSIDLPAKIPHFRNVGIISSTLGTKIIQPIIDRLNTIENLKVNLITVQNNFWGDKVTVTGLIVGKDIKNTLANYIELPKEIFIPSVMIRKYTNDFLDNITVKEIEQEFNIKIIVVENYYSFNEVIDFLLK